MGSDPIDASVIPPIRPLHALNARMVAHCVCLCRFPPRNKTNGKGKEGRGIGSHTDYGLFVISSQDQVGGENGVSPALVTITVI